MEAIGTGETPTAIRKATKLAGERFKPAAAELHRRGAIVRCRIEKGSRTYAGYAIAKAAA